MRLTRCAFASQKPKDSRRNKRGFTRRIGFSFPAVMLVAAFMNATALGQTSTQTFGTGTGSQTSQTGTTAFLPNPTVGTTWARAGATAPNAPIVLATASNPLGTTGTYARGAASSSASVSKFSPINGYTAGKEFYTSFKVLFGNVAGGSVGASDGTWSFYQGAGVMYSDANNFSGSQVFTGLQFTYSGSGALALAYRNGASASTAGLTTTAFNQGTVYTIEIFGNNKTSGTINYTYAGVAQSVAVQRFDLYINGTLIGNDLSEAQLPANSDITSTTFIGLSSTSATLNAANVFVDDVVVYNAVPAAVGISTSLNTLPDFGTVSVGSNSAEQSYTVSGTNLTTDITVTAPADFQVSTTGGGVGFGSAVTLTQVAGLVNAQTVFVRFAPGSPGSKSGNITHSSSGTATKNVAVTGTAVSVLNVTTDPTVTEGNSGTTVATFTVTLTPASANTVTVHYSTQDSTATAADNDYVAIPDTLLTFTPGQTTKNIDVTVNGDTKFEPNEQFFFNINTPSNANISDNQGIGTITNDDPTPTLNVANDQTVTEGNAGTTLATFNVTLSNPSSQAITVHYSTQDNSATVADNDYVAIPDTILTFNPGDISKNISVIVNGDTNYEADEQFFFNINNPLGANISDNQGIGTITNDDNPPATLVVTNTSDNNGVCVPGNCSLRQALNSANANSDLTTINFNIPGAGVHTITPGPGAALPVVTEAVIIDGYSQPGSAANTLTNGDNAVLLIELNGTSAPLGSSGLRISGGNSTVRGLVLNRWGAGIGNGITISSLGGNIISGNFIGTDPTGTVDEGNFSSGIEVNTSTNNIGLTSAAGRNVISGNDGQGITIQGVNTTLNNVVGNFVGTNVAGTGSLGNAAGGVHISGGAHDNTVGGAVTGRGNVISGNGGGVQITGPNTNNNTVQGNYIGTDVTGTLSVGNSEAGVSLSDSASSNTIGGSAAGAGNVISGNTGTFNIPAGVVITDLNTNSNMVQGNFIGVAADGASPLGNTGGGAGGCQGVMIIANAQNNIIGGVAPGAGNIIANNFGNGVEVYDYTAPLGSTTGNSIRGNSIYGNTLLGINLLVNGENPTLGTVTANDTLDADAGSNNAQNFPLISASTTGISGTLNSTANATFTIDFYASATCDASGNGEGASYLGSLNTGATDVNGDVAFNFTTSLTAGQVITATATDANGNTSEYSACSTVTSSDVVFNSSGSLAAGTYHNVTINNCTTFVDLTGDITITGTLTINDCSHLQTNAFTVSGSGAFVLADGGWLHIGSLNGITSGTTLSGNIQVTGGRSFSIAGNYVYTGTANQVVGNGLPGTVSGLLISNTGPAGNNTVTGNSGQVVTGLLEVVAGVYSSASDYKDVQVDAPGTLSLTGGITVNGDWTNNGIFIPNGNSVTFAGAANQNVGGSAPNNFAALTMNGAGGVTLIANTSVSGALTLTVGKITTGSNTLTLDTAATTTGASSLSYVIGTLKKSAVPNGSFNFPVGTVIGYTPVSLANASGGGDLTVSPKTPQQPALNGATSLQEYWTLASAGSLTTDLTFNYLDSDAAGTEANYRIIRVEGGNATSFPNNCPGSPCVDTNANTATMTGVQSFSDWTVAEPAAPTAIRLNGFAATRSDNDVLLQWQSGYETRNLGYYVYREQNGKRTQITPSLVAGSALMVGRQTVMSAGLTYAWYDHLASKPGRGLTVDALSPVSYWLEDVDLDGTRTLHGPIVPSLVTARSKQDRPAQSEMLKNLRPTGSGVTFSSWPADFADQQKLLVTPPALNGAKPSLTQTEIAALPGLKIAVSRTGWYRISKALMLAAGFNPKDNEPLLQLYANATEVPIKLPINGFLDANSDCLEFYGHGLDSPTDATQTYYLVVGKNAGKRIGMNTNGHPGDPSGPPSFELTIERKDRLVYFSSLLNGDAENFFGQVIEPTPVSETLPVSHPDLSGGQARLEVTLVGVTQNAHDVSVTLNGHNLGTVTFSNTEHPTMTFTLPPTALVEGENTVQFAALGGDADISLVDTVRLTYPHLYAADNNSLAISSNSARIKRVSGFTSGQIRAVDITNPGNPVEIQPVVDKDDDLGFYTADVQVATASTREPHTILLFAENTSTPVDSITSNIPSAWGTHTAGSDYVIVTTRDLKASLERLAALRRARGMIVDVIDVEDLYDEFSFGMHSPQAIKSFLQTANTNWTRKPRYLLLAGDSSYDPKNYFGRGFNDLVPTRLIDTALMEAASDDWLADFDGDGLTDLAIGRLPVRVPADADTMVTKIVNYENSIPDPARGALLVADSSFESSSSTLHSVLPAGLTVQTINRSGGTDALTHSQIVAGLNQGPKVANYFGHGSNGVWTSAPLLSSPDAALLTNTDHLSVFTMMTCFNGFFQDAINDSLSEALLKAQGGAVAVWASTTLTEPAGQNTIDLEFYRRIFAAQPATLGDASRAAKGTATDADVKRTWTLFGDPAMRIR
jgi:Peptidase family C25/Calx-beta domain